MAPLSTRFMRLEQAPPSSGGVAASFTVVDVSIISLKMLNIFLMCSSAYEEDATQQHNIDVNTSRDVSAGHNQGGVHEPSNDPMHEPACRKEDGDGIDKCFEAMDP
ncbi:unnamed protein product [Urochloa humidicola]